MTGKKQQIALDRTLRFLYDTIRYRRHYLMAIEFQHKGTKYRADTPAEAVALRMELERRDAAEGDAFPPQCMDS